MDTSNDEIKNHRENKFELKITLKGKYTIIFPSRVNPYVRIKRVK
jgi:hypothetical protein